MSIRRVVENIFIDWLRSQFPPEKEPGQSAPPGEQAPRAQEPAPVLAGRQARAGEKPRAAVGRRSLGKKFLAGLGMVSSAVLIGYFQPGIVGDILQPGNGLALLAVGICGLGMGLEAPGFSDRRGAWVLIRALGGVALMLASLAVGDKISPIIDPTNYYLLYLLTACLVLASLIICLSEGKGAGKSLRISNYLAFLSLAVLLVAIGSSVQGRNVLPDFMAWIGLASVLAMLCYFGLSLRRAEESWRISMALPGFIGIFGMLIAVFTLLFPMAVPNSEREVRIHFVRIIKAFDQNPFMNIDEALHAYGRQISCDKNVGLSADSNDGWFSLKNTMYLGELVDCAKIALTIRPHNPSESFSKLLRGYRRIVLVIERRERREDGGKQPVTCCTPEEIVIKSDTKKGLADLLERNTEKRYVLITDLVRGELSYRLFSSRYEFRFRTKVE